MKSKKIAITGGIGSGKSLVLSLLKDLGYPVFSCDEIYAQLTQERAFIERLQLLFPTAVVHGRIDRQALAEIVFLNEKPRKQLNDFSHPLIMEHLYKQMDECASTLVFAEVPLLFEGNYHKGFDGVIVVKRRLEERIAAVCQRDNVAASTAKAKIAAQFNYDDPKNQKIYINANVHILENDGSKEVLKEKLAQIVKLFL